MKPVDFAEVPPSIVCGNDHSLFVDERDFCGQRVENGGLRRGEATHGFFAMSQFLLHLVQQIGMPARKDNGIHFAAGQFLQALVRRAEVADK